PFRRSGRSPRLFSGVFQSPPCTARRTRRKKEEAGGTASSLGAKALPHGEPPFQTAGKPSESSAHSSRPPSDGADCVRTFRPLRTGQAANNDEQASVVRTRGLFLLNYTIQVKLYNFFLVYNTTTSSIKY